MSTSDLQTRPFSFSPSIDIDRIRSDFPILQERVYDRPLIYLDNAASSQKPRAVLDRLQRYYAHEHSNVHRGVHRLSQIATDAYEAARERVRRFVNARHTHEIIFTRGTTESINLVASAFGRSVVREGDNVVITTMEHHSNIVPWQMLCEEKGAQLRVVPINNEGDLLPDAFVDLLTERTRILAFCHISNSLGTINPVAAMAAEAHRRGISVVVDGAQAVPHMRVDVQDLDVDFYAFSSHKMFGPTGVGVLFGKEHLLEAMPPYQGGGDMIDAVSFEKTTYNSLPYKFEAGTPNIAGVVGLGAAIEYLESVGLDAIESYEHDLLRYATERLSSIDDLRIYGTAKHKASVLSFLVGDIHPYDAGTVLDRLGIAVRTGHHCTQPLMDHWNLPGTCRASLAFYNTTAEVDALVEGIHQVKRFFG